MFQDLKQALRVLLKTKGWTAVVLLSLALGIGANTALFSGVNGLLLRTVALPHPESLVRLKSFGKNDMRTSSSGYGFNGKTASGEDIRESMSYPMYQTLRAANQTLVDIAASAPLGNLNIVTDGKAELSSALIVSGNYFHLLEIPIELGRALAPEDDAPSASPTAVISYGFWQRRFGGQPSVIGKTVTMNNTPVTIVGVTRQEFTGIQNLTDPGPDVTVPLSLDARLDSVYGSSDNKTSRLDDGTWWWLQIMGRLKPGVRLEQVRGNLSGPFEDAARVGWASYFSALTPQQQAFSRNHNRTAVPHLMVESARRGIYDVDGDTLQSAKILSVVVGLLLAIVCANVANLLLSRASSRQKEVAVRLSLGATRTRLVRQLLTESLLLSFLGGGIGIVVGYWARALLPFADSAPMDWRVLCFALALCAATGVAFGLFPALRATEGDLSGAMKETSRSISRSRTLLTKSLIVVQVTISVAVLIGAGMFLRTLQNLRNVNSGFNTRNLVVFTVNPALNRYDSARITNLYNDLQRNLEAIPGVRTVGRSNITPLSGSANITNMYIQGKIPADAASAQPLDLWLMSVSPDFLETFEIPVVRGRNFDERDLQPKAPKVCLINESAAKQYFPGEDPVGKRWGHSPETPGDIEIVGIIGDIKYRSVRDAAPPTTFIPQPPDAGSQIFEVRTAGNPTLFMTPIREMVQRVDPTLPVARMSTEVDLVEGRLKQERFFALSYSLFGALALLLASIGLFGVMSYNVARRTNEIGIRMALGAEKGAVVRMILHESLWMVVAGIVLGCVAAQVAHRMIAAMMFGLATADAVSIGTAVALMFGVSLLAGYLPARRASRVDPMVALHYE